MAFKTDKIKLRLYTGGDPTAENGELAIVDNVLRLKSNGSWADVSGGGGGGLANVVEDTSPQLGGDLDANGNNILLRDNTIYTDTAETSSINTAKVTSWDSTSTLVSSNSANWDSAYTSVNTNAANWDSTSTVVAAGAANWNSAYGWGDHSTQGYSTVDDLNDLSDVSTPATLDGSHEDKVIGVVSTGGTASVLTLDHSAIADDYVTQTIYFTVGGTEYQISYDSSGSATSDTDFDAITKSATINGAAVTNDQMGTDLRTLMAVFQDGTESTAYAITGAGATMTMTANAVGVASNILYPSTTASALETGMAISQTAGLDSQYQYELIDQTGGSVAGPINTVNNADTAANITLQSGNQYNDISYVNTANFSGNLIVPPPSSYPAYTKITIMNASVHDMVIQDDSSIASTQHFNIMSFDPPLRDNFTLEAFQKAYLFKTTNTTRWDVVLSSI